MMIRYLVTHADPSHVMADLLRMWRDNLPVAGDPEDKYNWLYRDAPERPEGVFVLAAPGEAPDDVPRVVGTAGVLVRTVVARGRELRAGLLADLAVDRGHRTVRPALELVREARRRALERYDVAYGFPNRAAAGVFQRCGYRRLGVMYRYALVLRHAGYVRELVDLPAISQIAGAVLDVARMALAVPRALAAARAYRLEWAHDVDERFDALWAQARGAYEVVGKRDAAFLTWRFAYHPAANVRIACLLERGAGRALRAYAMLERQGDTMHVRDLFGHPGELGVLLDLLIPRLALDGVASVSMAFAGSRHVVKLLEARGFRRRESQRTIVFDTSREFADDLLRVERWHITDADEDT